MTLLKSYQCSGYTVWGTGSEIGNEMLLSPLAQLQPILVAKASFKLSIYVAVRPNFSSHAAFRSAPSPPLLDCRHHLLWWLRGTSLPGFGKNRYREEAEEMRQTVGCVKRKKLEERVKPKRWWESGAQIGGGEGEKYPKVGERNGEVLEQEEVKGKEKRNSHRTRLSGETGN